MYLQVVNDAPVHHLGLRGRHPGHSVTPRPARGHHGVVAVWHEECEHSRQHAARFDLDDTGLREGQECSLRWIYTHMIEEYARHNGHADLLRELVDGAVGW